MSFKKTQLALVVAATIGLTGCFDGVDAPTFPMLYYHHLLPLLLM